MTEGGQFAGVSFDLFDTLIRVERPQDPAAAVATALTARGVAVPEDWAERYATDHCETAPGRALSLVDHVEAALDGSGTNAERSVIRAALYDAFEGTPTLEAGARGAIRAASAYGPVGLLSNCSVPGLVEHTLARVGIDGFDAVVVSVDCGWRKPDPRAFETVARNLSVPPSGLLHVGDDPRTDGGVTEVGGRFVSVEEFPLTELPAELEAGRWG